MACTWESRRTRAKPMFANLHQRTSRFPSRLGIFEASPFSKNAALLFDYQLDIVSPPDICCASSYQSTGSYDLLEMDQPLAPTIDCWKLPISYFIGDDAVNYVPSSIWIDSTSHLLSTWNNCKLIFARQFQTCAYCLGHYYVASDKEGSSVIISDFPTAWKQGLSSSRI